MLIKCSWLLALKQEQAVPSTMVTEISDFQLLCSFFRFKRVLVDQLKVTFMLQVFCQILGVIAIVVITVIFTYLCAYTIHIKLRRGECFDKEICALKLQACSFLPSHSRLVIL